jgi:saccharopine dehydrogenase-like NADP-dependent oxidoreductase
MKRILVIGAGRSSSSLIQYLLQNAEQENWHIIVADLDVNLAQSKIKSSNRAEAIVFDASNHDSVSQRIAECDLVISMLPASMHVGIAEECIHQKKHLITPSYISPQMAALNDKAIANDVLIMNELGVDPGIDHMSAKKVLDHIASMGAEITCFESFTGGLVSPESDDNIWNYKFTWNPRNVVMAGQGGAAKFIQEGKYKYIPYHKLFRRTEIIDIDNYGKFEGYANRDSLRYRDVYGLQKIPTIYRGTLRRVGFCRFWDVLVQLGMTDDSYPIENSEAMTFREFTNSFLAYDEYNTVELKLRYYMKIDQDDTIFEKFEQLGLFSNEVVGLKNATPARILQHILEKKWSLNPNDKDMIVMWHKFGFNLDGKNREINSSMVYIGKDQTYTAMSDTVGLPVAICAKMLLQGKINLRGVHLPIQQEIYNPILDELETLGVVFTEKEVAPVLYHDRKHV